MQNKSIVVFCPNPFSFYTNSVVEILLSKGYNVEMIVVRKFSIGRFTSEFSRDGRRLLKKIWKKLVLRKSGYNSIKTEDTVISFREKLGLKVKKIDEFKSKGIKIVKCNTLNDSNVEAELKRLDNKLIVFTGGGIIRDNILKVAGDGIINCHMGILPKYKGMDLPEWSVLERDEEKIGLTLHFMDTGIDTGDILKKVRIERRPKESIKELRARFEPFMIQSMVDVVEGLLDGSLKAQKQVDSEYKQYFIMHPTLVGKVNEITDEV